jgi:hypothetical protein
VATQIERGRRRERREFARRTVRGGVEDVRMLQRRIERGRPDRAPARSRAVGAHPSPISARVATSEWDLARAQAGQATYRRLRAAIREAASSGVETVLTGSTELSSSAALAYAKQYMPLEGITTVDAHLEDSALVIRPHPSDGGNENGTGSFGIIINHSIQPGEPSNLPNSNSVPLKGGTINAN